MVMIELRKMERSRAFLFVAVVGCLVSQINAQQAGCSGPPNSTQVATLIASNINLPQGTATITLQISPAGFTFRVVCLSSSGIRNQYRFVSIVAYYLNSNTGVTQYGQFEFECVSSVWSATSNDYILGLTTHNRQTLTANSPAITATNRTDCSYCLNGRYDSPPRFTDMVNHCNACSGCDQPLCYITDTSLPPSGSNFTSACCNYYLSDGNCTTACPPSSYPDGNRTCVPCSLTCQNGGTLRSDRCACNCTAVSTGNDCSVSASSCPCNGASILCGTYAVTSAGSTNVDITGTYLKCSIAANVTSFRQHAVLTPLSSSPSYFQPGSLVLLKQLQAISVSPGDYSCTINQQLLQHNASVSLSNLGYKGLGLSYLTGQNSIGSTDFDLESLSKITISGDYTAGGTLDSSVACALQQLVQWLSSPQTFPPTTCRASSNGATVASFSVSCF